MKVRTTGTKRARTMALLPCFSKKTCALSKCSGLRRRPPRAYSGAPTARPISYPTTLPRKAAAVSTMQATTMLTRRSISCWGFWIARPIVKSNESPGKKKVNSPHSAKMTSRLAQKADGPSCLSSSSALSQSGPRVWITGQSVGRGVGPDLFRFILGHDPTGATELPKRALTDIGVGPWVGPWPTEPELSLYDEQLLFEGDRRNVVDKYRYWRHEAIVRDLDLHQHDYHHPTGEDLGDWAAAAPAGGGAHGIPIIGIDNLPGSQPIETYALPRHCLLLFGQEGPGLSPQAREASVAILDIAQFGSTRSINAGAAAAIAMHAWVRQHVFDQAR